MTNDYLKNALRLAGIRLAFIVLTVFMVIAFAWLINMDNGLLYYSIIVCLFYFSWIYNDSYQVGERDMRAKRGKTAKGFIYALMSESVSVLLLLAALIFEKAIFAYILWQAPYAGFILRVVPYFDNLSISIWYVLIIFFVPVVSGTGYAFGLKNKQKHKKNEADR